MGRPFTADKKREGLRRSISNVFLPRGNTLIRRPGRLTEDFSVNNAAARASVAYSSTSASSTLSRGKAELDQELARLDV